MQKHCAPEHGAGVTRTSSAGLLPRPVYANYCAIPAAAQHTAIVPNHPCKRNNFGLFPGDSVGDGNHGHHMGDRPRHPPATPVTPHLGPRQTRIHQPAYPQHLASCCSSCMPSNTATTATLACTCRLHCRLLPQLGVGPMQCCLLNLYTRYTRDNQLLQRHLTQCRPSRLVSSHAVSEARVETGDAHANETDKGRAQMLPVLGLHQTLQGIQDYVLDKGRPRLGPVCLCQSNDCPQSEDPPQPGRLQSVCGRVWHVLL